ncbi:MAG TPA: DUF1761 domain-containing protein [Candidatus Rubrimentiphilum sp.]|nr:DUF1761 domain-containing protein [Candidatus Rubrimentiphilum sp.]
MSPKINHVAVFVSAIIFFVLSFLWYSFIFGKMYMAQIAAMTGKAPGMPASMTVPLIETFLLGWFLSYVIAIALAMRPDPNPAARGFGFGLFIGIGVFASMSFLGVIWGSLPVGLWAINAGFVTLAMAIMGYIMGAWSKPGTTAV